MSLTCPNCGNAENFLAKTLQMHLVRVADGQVQPPMEEGRPALFELLCDECDATLDLEGFNDDERRELMVTLGAR
ncbi:MAG: hypothetical protein EXQ49_12220 [Acidobacteria bacterium]|jgi:hypothetical protein|nr:hypothetical protein [Acidobacteriota bacterium]MSO50640.1 hypothetical protein [Acidobacteriota bacterium]